MLFVTQQLREAVELRLQTIEVRAAWLESTANWPNTSWDDDTRVWAAERALHVAIEGVTDIGNLIIDALVMREPGGYADIVGVIAEEGVVSRDWFEAFRGALSLRNQLVRDYAQLPPEVVTRAVRAYGTLFTPFVTSVRHYLGMPSK